MKKLLIVLMLLLMTGIVSAEYRFDSGKTVPLILIDTCYGDATVKVRGHPKLNITRGDYSIYGCSETSDNLWACKCAAKNTSIFMPTRNGSYNVYDVVVQYYIGNLQTDENKRVENINDVWVGNVVIPDDPVAPLANTTTAPAPKPPKTTLSTDMDFFLVGVIGFVFILAVVIVGAIIFFMKPSTDDDMFTRRNKNRKPIEPLPRLNFQKKHKVETNPKPEEDDDELFKKYLK